MAAVRDAAGILGAVAEEAGRARRAAEAAADAREIRDATIRGAAREGLSTVDIAAAAGLSQPVVWRIVNAGKQDPPGVGRPEGQ